MRPVQPLGTPPFDGGSGLAHIDWIRWWGDLAKAVENLSTQTYAPVTPSALTRANDTNVTVTLTGSPTVALLAPVLMTMGWTGVLAPSRGGTGIASYTIGDLLYASGATTLATRAAVATGAVLVSQGVATAPVWSVSPRVDNITLAKVDGANIVLWAQHDPTIYGTVGTAVGNVGGVKLGLSYQPVRFTSGPVLEPTYIDDTWHIGSNVGTGVGGIGRQDLTKPMVALSFESKFYSSVFAQEVHIQGVTSDGLTTFRPMSFFLAHDGSVIDTTFVVDRMVISDKSGIAMLQVNDANGAADLGTTAQPIKLRFAKNNVSAIQQIDAAGAAFIDLLFLDGSNIATIAAPLDVVSVRRTANFAVFQPTTSNSNDTGVVVSAPSLAGNYFGFRSTGAITGPMRSELENTAAAANSHAEMRLVTSGGSGGDPFVFFSIPGVTNWSLGTDNSDSDHFKLSQASTVGANTVVVSVGGVVGIGTATFPSTGTAGLIFADGTALATMGSNTAGLYANDVAGTVKMFAIDEAGTTGEIQTVSATLTSGRVAFATTGGQLTDDADLTFATDTLTATKLSAPTSVSTGTLAQTGKTTTYNNVATAGWGEPAIYGSGRSTAQVAAVASVAAYTCGAADGSFIVSMNVNVTTSTTHNFTAECAYTDETNTARVLTMTFSQLAGVFVTAITNVTGAGPYEGVPMHIRVKASTAITLRTQAAGTYTTVTYNVEGLIQQVA